MVLYFKIIYNTDAVSSVNKLFFIALFTKLPFAGKVIFDGLKFGRSAAAGIFSSLN